MSSKKPSPKAALEAAKNAKKSPAKKVTITKKADKKPAPVKKVKKERGESFHSACVELIKEQKHTDKEIIDRLAAKYPNQLLKRVCDFRWILNNKQGGSFKRFIRDESGKLIEAEFHQKSASKKDTKKKKIIITAKKVAESLPQG